MLNSWCSPAAEPCSRASLMRLQAEMGKRVRIGLPRRAEGESALLQRPDSVVAAGLVQCAIDAGALGVENAWGVRRRQGFRERLKTFFIGDY